MCGAYVRAGGPQPGRGGGAGAAAVGVERARRGALDRAGAAQVSARFFAFQRSQQRSSTEGTEKQ